MMTGTGLLAGSAAALGALALYNRNKANRAEAECPPAGQFLDVNGVRVHYMELGRRDGPPVVLIHGNVILLQDWLLSGVVDRLAADHRVILFDRPGFGYTSRPPSVTWGPLEQAALLRDACHLLGADTPVVAGQSYGALVALAWALDGPKRLSGLLLAAGYYYPTTRLDAALVTPAATPVIGPVLRNTISPPFARSALPATFRAMFAPNPVPERYWAHMPTPLITRPSHIRATAEDGAVMVAETERLLAHPGAVTVPTVVFAGTDDKVVDPDAQSVRLARALGAEVEIVPGVGHMVHYLAADRVAQAIARLATGGERTRALAS